MSDETNTSAAASAVKEQGFFRSIGTKASVPLALVVLAVAFLAYQWQTEHERYTLMQAKNVAGNMVVRMLSSAAVAPLEFDDPEGIEEELEYIKGDEEVVGAAVWKITDGALSPEPIASYQSAQAAGVDAPPIHKGSKIHEGEHVVGFSRMVEAADGTPLGMARIDLSLDRELAAFERTEQLFKRIAIGFVGAVILVLVLVLRVVVVSPLSSLVDAARKIEKGGSARAEAVGRDEIGRLAKGFNNMAVAIEEREERIAASNRQLTRLFDNMRQSIFSFGPDLKIHGEASKAGQAIFGEDLEGASVAEVLLGGVGDDSPEWEALTLWLEAVFPHGAAGWDELVDLAPKETVLHPGLPDEKQLLLEFRPIIEKDELQAVMVLATDETEKRALARRAREMQSRHEREMASMRKILASGTQLFVDFLRSTDQRLERMEQVVGTPSERLRRGAIDELFRHAHTIKGEARTFELLELRDAAERLEEALGATRKEFGTERERSAAFVHEELSGFLSKLRASYDETRRRFVEASPIGEGVLDQTTVSRADLARLLSAAQGPGTAPGATILPLVERLASRPFGEVMVAIADATPTWAESVGKRARLTVEGGTLRIPARLADVLPAVMTHLVRNSISHGIELPGIRDAAGKDIIGHLAVACSETPRGVEIEYRDDGAGFDFEKLEAAAGGSAQGAEAAFADGVSTTAGDELSGRGVGLSAVREELAAAGYTIELSNRDEGGARVRLSPKTSASLFG